MLGIDRKKKKIILAIAAGAVAIFCVWWFWPEKPAPSREPLEVQPAFLDVESPWVDSLINSMSVDEKIAQLVFVDATLDLVDTALSSYSWGGEFLSGTLDDDVPNTAAIDSSGIPALRAPRSMYSVWPDASKPPGAEYMLSVPDTLVGVLRWLSFQMAHRLSSNSWILDADSLTMCRSDFLQHYEFVQGKKWFTWVEIKGELLDPEVDSTENNDSILNPLKELGKQGLPGLLLDRRSIARNFGRSDLDLAKYLDRNFDFRGILGMSFTDSSVSQLDIESGFRAGVDVFVTPHPEKVYKSIRALVGRDVIDREVLDNKVRRVLQAKAWMGLDSLKHPATYQSSGDRWLCEEWSTRARESAVTVVRNDQKVLPVKDRLEMKEKILLLRVGGRSVHRLLTGLSEFAETGSRVITDDLGNVAGYTRVVVAITHDTTAVLDSVLIRKLGDLQAQIPLTVACFGDISSLKQLGRFQSVIHSHDISSVEQKKVADIITGGGHANGRLYTSIAGMERGHGIRLAPIRLSGSRPELVNMSGDTLEKIAWIAQEGIRMGAYPGCQVLIARKGRVVYNRSFGHLTYARKIPVTNDHLYDLASVTKITGTTLAAMKLYELGFFRLQDSLKDYLPDTLREHLPFNRLSTLSNVTWSELMTHRSGLPAGYPVIEFMDYQDTSTGRFDRFFCDRSDDSMFNIQVAEDMYLDRSYFDSIWVRINSMWLDPGKEYRYSDVNFNVLYTMLRSHIEGNEQLAKRDPLVDTGRFDAFRKFLRDSFYDPMDMNRTCYLPLSRFTRQMIAPTEDDRFWRKQLIHGFVHDPTAALYGGIAGNAGLFSSAQSVAKLYQMWLNEGSYGGRRYLNPATVRQFTKRQPGSHRGLGFNKPVGGGMYGIPVEASLATYGHTGWTGNSVWIDPEKELIFIFLSNRSHPVSDNPKIIQLGIRNRIHLVAYQAIMDGCIPWIKSE